MSAVDWRALYVKACIAFEAERPGIWLDLEEDVELPEMDQARRARANQESMRRRMAAR